MFLVVVVAVLFLFLPKRLSKGLFLVFEPIEMVIDLLYNASPPDREHYKGIEVFYLMLVNSNSTQLRLTHLRLTVHSF